MNQYKKLFKNTFAMLIGNFSSKILVFLMLPVYTAYLSTSEYGIVDLIFTTTSLLYPLLSIQASETMLRFALDNTYDKSQVFSTSLKLHICGFLILLILSPLLNFIPTLYEYRFIFYLYFFCITLSDILLQFAKGCNSIKDYSFCGFLNSLVTVSLNILFLVVFKAGIYGYVFSYTIASLTVIVFLFFRLKLYKYFYGFFKIDYGLLKEMLKYSIPMIPNSICWWINNSLDRYILLIFTTTSAVGIYSAANKIPSLLTVFYTIFINAWQISSVDGFGTEENKIFFSNVYRKLSALIICATAVIIAFTGIISKILFDVKFSDAESFTQILLLAFIFHAMANFLGTIYTASKKTTMLFLSTLTGALINLILNFVLIPQYGCLGASTSTAASYLFVWLLRLINTKKIIKLSINLIKDIICYTLIILECIVILSKVKYGVFITTAIIAVLFIINYNELKNMFEIKKLKHF